MSFNFHIAKLMQGKGTYLFANVFKRLDTELST